MKDVSYIKALVIDHGLFVPLAQKLGEQYAKVWYWSPYDDTMPKVEKGMVGDGFDNVERVPDIWGVLKDVDLAIFPDVGFGGLQQHLIGQGVPVWGHHGGDLLETNRGLFLQRLSQAGLNVPPYRRVQGLTTLAAYLRGKTDCYVKVSKWRGDWETFHWRDWASDEAVLDFHAYKLGPVKELLNFYVFDKIETNIEDGMDAYFVNGFPQTVIHGMEAKDKAFIGTVQAYTELPDEVRETMDRFAGVLAEYDYRGFFSSELRIKEGESYFIDPTCRAGSPPMQSMINVFKNLGEIIWNGARGELTEPETDAEFCGQVLLTAARDRGDWLTLEIPDDIRDQCKFGFACEINGRVCIPPHDLQHMVGWLTAQAGTIAEVVEKLKAYARQLPDGLECNVADLAPVVEEIESAEVQGMEFTDQPVPSPAIVVDSNGES